MAPVPVPRPSRPESFKLFDLGSQTVSFELDGWVEPVDAHEVGHGEFPTSCRGVQDILARYPNLRTCKLNIGNFPEDRQLVGLTSPFAAPSAGFRLHGPENLAGATSSRSSSLATSTPCLESISIGIDTESFTQSSLADFLRDLPPTIRRLHITVAPGSSSPKWQGFATTILNDDTLATFPCPTTL
ncbi:hypothetical protein B0H14DRAFT_3488233 [Mycena olivaceomarginata]|nr:hypothetical protein B0H14DRAFT_3488233 [Mycena olivaceomarginata]